ncbi:HpcH/HpaI aldolase/citrate lyase family protein [Methylobacterium persicinum]|uniref:Citrate lyase subunit beta/citryl-CoA lyase n=1 Tax=Methylobacterium persicinum TaxID=374426 RepID=A0ABU0HN46_9HYPH|nr:CoA ester lyase [Methylobacterium persicinum]MDQ0443745.1 citrate lyase subunit beta/citryl-CoA lyase [Methylobacterium persicinum]GJE40129.1 (3S)-malyl-CoA thioesterase [Methylobacterium persicinum]
MLMRSKLFVPGSRPELFPKAAASDADALSFDLEDSVPASHKAEARENLRTYLAGAAFTHKIMVVRVNAVGTDFFAEDLAAVALARTDLINLPMVEEPAAIAEAAARLDRLPEAGHIRLLVNIESPRGLRRAAELAGAHPRVAGLQIGYADLLEPTGIDRTDQAALAHLRLVVRFAAAEAGLPAYDAAFPVVKDPDGYRAECEAARRHGFAGKSCIHPSQIAMANAAFLPTPAEVEWSRRILVAAAEGEAHGHGAILVDGRMIDAPFLSRARAVVALADLHAKAKSR